MLDYVEETAVTVLLGTMVVVVFLQVIFRFILKSSLPWSEELARYLMVWAVFIGASMGAKVGAHIGVEAFVKLLPQRIGRYAPVLAGLITAAFCVIMVGLSLQVVQKIQGSGQVSPAMLIPMYWAYLALPVGFSLMALRSIQVVFEKLFLARGSAQ
ncbi:hypothetical protein SY88_16455 [Clostridiales bacterium PH28_bin88]|nr:hypothetical protein SY88_16455 [Clostridiales bacterium PH28_bin88]